VQVLETLGPRLVGAQLRAIGVIGATRLIVAVLATLLRVAVTVAL
jgi:hypothetical protein